MKLSYINENQIRELSKKGMNLSHYWVLDLLNAAREYDQDAVQVLPNVKEVKLLKDRFLIDEKGINVNGQKFYQEISNIKEEDVPKKSKKEPVIESRFEEWWNEYPGSANFSYRGMSFTSSRALRGNKQVCKMLYDAAVASKVTTEAQILNSTKFMVEEAKKESFDSGVNKLQYLPGAEVFLRQQRYLSFEVAEGTDNDSDNSWA